VNFADFSWCETGPIDFAQRPSKDLIGRLAALDADEDEFLILAKKVPPTKRERVFERPKERLASGLRSLKEIGVVMGQNVTDLTCDQKPNSLQRPLSGKPTEREMRW
jgi:hypothetical protein